MGDPQQDRKTLREQELRWIEAEKTQLLPLEAIRNIPIQECGEPLMSLREAGLYCHQSNRKMRERIGKNDIYLRASIVQDLQDINRELEEHGLELLCNDGWRDPAIQEEYFNKELERIRKAQPELNEEELRQEASIFAAAPDVAPHPTGAALDATLVLKRTHDPLDMGCAIDENSEKMWRHNPFLDEEQKANRELLNSVFEKRGFFLYPGEYWHVSKGDREATAYQKNADHAKYGPTTLTGPVATA